MYQSQTNHRILVIELIPIQALAAFVSIAVRSKDATATKSPTKSPIKVGQLGRFQCTSPATSTPSAKVNQKVLSYAIRENIVAFETLKTYNNEPAYMADIKKSDWSTADPKLNPICFASAHCKGRVKTDSAGRPVEYFLCYLADAAEGSVSYDEAIDAAGVLYAIEFNKRAKPFMRGTKIIGAQPVAQYRFCMNDPEDPPFLVDLVGIDGACKIIAHLHYEQIQDCTLWDSFDDLHSTYFNNAGDKNVLIKMIKFEFQALGV